MTSIDMMGASLSILKLDSEIKKYDFEVDLHTKDEGRAVEGDMIYLELDENGLILVER